MPGNVINLKSYAAPPPPQNQLGTYTLSFFFKFKTISSSGYSGILERTDLRIIFRGGIFSVEMIYM